LIAAQDQRLELERKIAEAEGQMVSTSHLLESLKEQRKVYIGSWHDDNLTNLVSVKDQLEQAKDDLAKARRLSELVNLVAPMDAVVLQIPGLSSGGVATDAEPLFSLMPVDAPLEVDAQIDSKDSGFVKVGDRVTIKFDTYKFLEHGTGQGVVKTISQDSFTELSGQDSVSKKGTKESRSPYFDARITVTGLHLHDVPPDVRLIPGMTLEADIIVGKRTILWYLVGGALRSGAEAMHEP
jgi:HlyD family type I secretion membrane fusion protein